MTSTLLPDASSATSPTLYVGDAEEYSVAFKAEEAQMYVMQLAGATQCYFTEPREDLGPSGFSAFPAPKLMQEGPLGFVADETLGGRFGGGSARVRANLSDGVVTGDFSFSESEASLHCDTGFSGVPFEASRYEPISSPGAAAPAPGEVATYYGSEGPIEIFLRTTGREAGGIRGTFVPRCPLGQGKAIPARHALFRRPAFAKRSENGRFSQRVIHRGQTGSGTRFKETISIAGRIEEGAVAGNYLRIRTTTPGRKSAQRCITGPLPFRAVRYLPVAG